MGRAKRNKAKDLKYYIHKVGDGGESYEPVIRVARVTGGKRKMIWAVKNGDGFYDEINITKAVLR